MGAVIGLVEVSWQAGHRGEEQEKTEREREGEQACKLCDDYHQHRGRLFSALPRLGGTGLGPRAGVRGGEKHRKRGRRGGETAREMETAGVREKSKDKLEKDRGEY